MHVCLSAQALSLSEPVQYESKHDKSKDASTSTPQLAGGSHVMISGQSSLLHLHDCQSAERLAESSDSSVWPRNVVDHVTSLFSKSQKKKSCVNLPKPDRSRHWTWGWGDRASQPCQGLKRPSIGRWRSTFLNWLSVFHWSSLEPN